MLFHIKDLQLSLALGYRVCGAKGDSTLKNQEQAQSNFSSTLTSAFKTQFGNQQGVLSFLTSKLEPMLNNPTGFSADTLATMRTQATEGTARSYGQAEQALHTAEASRGGNGLPSGVDAQLEALNANAGAAQNESSQQNITLADEQQKQANYKTALDALGGVAQMENPTGLAGAEIGAADSVGSLGKAYKDSQNSQLLSALGGIAGGVASVFGGPIGGAIAKKI